MEGPSDQPSYSSLQSATHVPVVADPTVASKLTGASGDVVQLYRYPGLPAAKAQTLLRKAKAKVSADIQSIDGELCYNVALTAPLDSTEAETLAW